MDRQSKVADGKWDTNWGSGRKTFSTLNPINSSEAFPP